MFHSATFDYDHLGERFGNRAVGIGEAPYFDPNSTTRSEALLKNDASIDQEHKLELDRGDPITA